MEGIIHWIRKRLARVIISIILVSLLPIMVIELLYKFGDVLGKYSINTTFKASDILTYYSTIWGTLIGALITFFVLYLTIRNDNTEREKDRRLQVAPYLNFTFRKTAQLVTTKNEFDNILFSVPDIPVHANTPNLCGVVTMRNVGVGPLFDCFVTDVMYKKSLFPRAVKVLNTNALEVGKEWDIVIGLDTICGEIPVHLLDTDDINGQWPHPNAIDGKSGEMQFTVCYKDILNTIYKQSVILKINIGAATNEEYKWEYTTDLYITSITPREIDMTYKENVQSFKLRLR